MIVIDTNVVSELMRPGPAPPVERWVRARVGRQLYTTSITSAEIRFGIERLPDGRRKRAFAATAAQLFGAFENQVLPFDAPAARHYAELARAREAAERHGGRINPSRAPVRRAPEERNR